MEEEWDLFQNAMKDEAKVSPDFAIVLVKSKKYFLKFIIGKMCPLYD